MSSTPCGEVVRLRSARAARVSPPSRAPLGSVGKRDFSEISGEANPLGPRIRLNGSARPLPNFVREGCFLSLLQRQFQSRTTCVAYG